MADYKRYLARLAYLCGRKVRNLADFAITLQAWPGTACVAQQQPSQEPS